jgi:hypothetical protein
MRPFRFPCLRECSAYQMVKLENTRMSVLTPVMTFGSSKGSPAELRGGQLSSAMLNRTMK